MVIDSGVGPTVCKVRHLSCRILCTEKFVTISFLFHKNPIDINFFCLDRKFEEGGVPGKIGFRSVIFLYLHVDSFTVSAS